MRALILKIFSSCLTMVGPIADTAYKTMSNTLKVCLMAMLAIHSIINVPPLINFSIVFQTPSEFIRSLCLLILRKLTCSTNPSFHFFLLLALLTPHIHGKIASFCIYFSFMLSDNLFFFFPWLYIHLKPFLKSQPPVYFDPPV